jgi:hypothetical protein
MSVQGGLFDGGWETGMLELCTDIVGAVSDTAFDAWRANLDTSIRVNQGRYMGQTRNTRVSDTVAELRDGRSVYGPWLEGTGSRNAPVTRFGGYHSARDAAEKVNAIATELAAPAVAEFVERQNR